MLFLYLVQLPIISLDSTNVKKKMFLLYFLQKQMLIFNLFMFALSVFIYSFSFFEVNSSQIQSASEDNKIILKPNNQQKGSSNFISQISDGKLFKTMCLGQFYLFLIFYFISYFSLGGIIILTICYLRDFFSKEILPEVQNNIFLAFSISQLIGALLKLIVYDWKKSNMFIIAIPAILIAISSIFVLKQSPSDLLMEYREIGDPNHLKLMTYQEKKNSISEEIYLIFKNICDINQRPFFTRNQFTILLERYEECYIHQEQKIKLSKQFAIIYINIIIGLLYFGPLFIVQDIGSVISFNMFALGFSEIFAILASFKFINYQNLRNGIKVNLIICGMIGFTITFPTFQNECHNSVCPTQVVQFKLSFR